MAMRGVETRRMHRTSDYTHTDAPRGRPLDTPRHHLPMRTTAHRPHPQDAPHAAGPAHALAHRTHVPKWGASPDDCPAGPATRSPSAHCTPSDAARELVHRHELPRGAGTALNPPTTPGTSPHAHTSIGPTRHAHAGPASHTTATPPTIAGPAITTRSPTTSPKQHTLNHSLSSARVQAHTQLNQDAVHERCPAGPATTHTADAHNANTPSTTINTPAPRPSTRGHPDQALEPRPRTASAQSSTAHRQRLSPSLRHHPYQRGREDNNDSLSQERTQPGPWGREISTRTHPTKRTNGTDSQAARGPTQHRHEQPLLGN